jgi:7,8-dihydropterin-6-yl-methyl-4-(beta-D-ribofuranosyl)aminobenzene 5'-phosphate synthase
MRVKIIFDKAASDKNLHTGWGFSALIGDGILFDTGEKGPWLLNNLKILGEDVNSIKGIVISHNHWDHTGGLWDILKLKKGLPVYACPGFGEEFMNKISEYGGEIIETAEPSAIDDNIYVTGEIKGEYKGGYMPEQAVSIKSGKGISVITGCSHPGIVKMAEKAKESFPDDRLHLVLGGFHLMDKDKRFIELTAGRLKDMGVEKAAPTHCSGPEAERIFERIFGSDFIPVVIGLELDV